MPEFVLRRERDCERVPPFFFFWVWGSEGGGAGVLHKQVLVQRHLISALLCLITISFVSYIRASDFCTFNFLNDMFCHGYGRDFQNNSFTDISGTGTASLPQNATLRYSSKLMCSFSSASSIIFILIMHVQNDIVIIFI